MNADILTDLQFHKPLELHLAHDAFATMVIREFEYQIPYGLVEVQDYQLLGLQEKPIKRYHMNTGIYVLSSNAVKCIPKHTYCDMTSVFEKGLENEEKLLTYLTDSYWIDIGRFEEFDKAQKDWLLWTNK